MRQQGQQKNMQNPMKGEKYPEFSHTCTPQLEALKECMAVCMACSKMCVEEGHKQTAALCIECGEICSLAIKACCGQSEFTHQILDLCAQVCQRCSQECSKMDAEHCQECADCCRHCAESCMPAGSAR